MSVNKAAWAFEAGKPLKVSEAPMPVAGPNEIIVANAAIAINPLDNHMQDIGVFVQEWPAILGCDIAGIVHEVGSEVTRFQKGDRVIGHTINLVTGRPRDGAYALYSAVLESKAAILPSHIAFKDGVVVGFAIEATVCALSVKTAGTAMPGVSTPALGLPYPTVGPPTPINKTLVIYGGSSSVGSMTTQLASATGIRVIAVASKHNFDLCKTAGADEVFDYHDSNVVEQVIRAISNAPGNEFIGIFDAIGTPETIAHDLAILDKFGGGHLALTHPPPAEGVPGNVKAGMIFAVDDVANPVWKDFVTPALASGQLKCLPHPTVVGKGLDFVQEALEKLKSGVSATKVVVEI